MSLHVILGPMFAGKTTEMIRFVKKAEAVNHKVLVVKCQLDTRYNNQDIVTHDNQELTSIVVSPIDELEAVINNELTNVSYDYICIDEIQFFKDAARIVNNFADKGYYVIVTCLQSDFKRKPFKELAYLIAYADKITHLTALDPETKTEAVFTTRLLVPKNDFQIEIGGKEIYRAACRKSYCANLKLV